MSINLINDSNPSEILQVSRPNELFVGMTEPIETIAVVNNIPDEQSFTNDNFDYYDMQRVEVIRNNEPHFNQSEIQHDEYHEPNSEFNNEGELVGHSE